MLLLHSWLTFVCLQPSYCPSSPPSLSPFHLLCSALLTIHIWQLCLIEEANRTEDWYWEQVVVKSVREREMSRKGASQDKQVVRDVTRRVKMRYIFIDLLPLPFLSNYSYYCSQIVSVQYLSVCLSVFKIIFQNYHTRSQHTLHYTTSCFSNPQDKL